nr:MAG: hypothetical protein [Microvirus sp.]
MATSSLPSVPSNPFDGFEPSQRSLLAVALASYEAVLRRRINSERNDQIRAIVESDLARVRVLMSNASES